LMLPALAISIAKENESIRNKDKFIEIGKNSLGCVQYRYNSDIVWKCPKEKEVTQIEKRVCTGGKYRSCRTDYEPVIGE